MRDSQICGESIGLVYLLGRDRKEMVYVCVRKNEERLVCTAERVKQTVTIG